MPDRSSLSAQTASVPQAAAQPSGSATVPRLIRYNGVLLDGRGWPIGTPTAVTFAIHTQPSGDDQPLWRETQQVNPSSKGGYTVLLGATSSNGLPPEVFQPGESQYLSVQAEGEPEQTRVLLVSVPYALKAGDATTLGGLPVSAFALAGSTKAVANSAIDGVHPDVVSNVTTTGGTAGYVPEFNGSATIIDSPIFVLGSDVGIGTATPTAPLTVSGNSVLNGALTVNGDSTFNGPFVLPPPATATASKGYNSQFIKLETSAWNSSTSSAVNPRFQWVGEVHGNNTATPTATLNLQSSTTAAVPTETGFHFNANGTIQFAPGQTFPGIGTITGVTAGTALTGGGTTGTVTVNVDTTKVPLLASANHFTASQSVTGSVSATGQLISTVPTGTAPLAVSSTTQVSNLNASLLGGLTPSAFAELAASNSFSATQTFTTVGIGAANNSGAAQLLVTSQNYPGIQATGGNHEDITGSGWAGIVIQGGNDENFGIVSSEDGGDGADVTGGSSAFEPGNGIYSVGGACVSVDGFNFCPSAGDAGYFDGNVEITGTLNGAAPEIKIDHPTDPSNKYLIHASVGSSEMMNIYSGNVVTDELGLAIVKLPDWFEAENTDFRYQLTVLDERFAQAVVSKKIQNRQFTIHTNTSHVEVSWQITAVRQDAFAKAHPLVVEQEKPARERGFYQNPELHGQPAEKQTEWGRHPQQMQHMKQMRDKQKVLAQQGRTQTASIVQPAIETAKP